MNYSPLDRMYDRDEFNDWLDKRRQEFYAKFGYPQPKAEISYTEKNKEGEKMEQHQYKVGDRVQTTEDTYLTDGTLVETGSLATITRISFFNIEIEFDRWLNNRELFTRMFFKPACEHCGGRVPCNCLELDAMSEPDSEFYEPAAPADTLKARLEALPEYAALKRATDDSIKDPDVFNAAIATAAYRFVMAVEEGE